MATKQYLLPFRRQTGFTLIEVLLVVALMTILAAIGTPIYGSLQNSNGLDVSVNTLAQYLYQAETFSRGEQHDSPWGVAVVGQTMVLYAGTTYAGRNSAYDTTFSMPVTLHTSGLSEVDFSKLYGLPSATGTFTLQTGSSSRTVTINSEGMVSY